MFYFKSFLVYQLMDPFTLASHLVQWVYIRLGRKLVAHLKT